MKSMLKWVVWLIVPVISLDAYPIDGFARTGIRRIERLQLIVKGELPGNKPVTGAMKGVGDIQLHLIGARGDSIQFPFIADPALQVKLDALFPNRDESYSVAVLDITPGKPFRYAARQADRSFSPGSVGKLAVAAGLFAELKRLYPDNILSRREILISRLMSADQWIRYDDHVVPVFDPQTRHYTSRMLREGDVFSLYEWLDHMMSASANAAASMVWKEAILMRAFGDQYPPSYEDEVRFFSSTSEKALQEMALSVVNDPLRAAGISLKEWQLGSMFTRRGKAIIPGAGSWGSPNAMLKFLVRLEQGMIADEWSSEEIKRLLYMTARRIRYASAPRLSDAAVYFKSGSLYKCRQEPGFVCKKFMGNVENVMNSLVIVEHPDSTVYCVALMSNVLKKNSAVEHQTLATYIDRILTQ